MKFKRWVSLALFGVMSLSCFSSCATNNGSDIKLTGEKVYLNYATGMDEFGNFNNDLYSYNQMDAIGGDPGAIYVPKERDAEDGGYYYMYVTGGLKEQFGWDGNPGLYGYDEDVEALAISCYRSKDLSTWSLCGSERGYTIAGRESDWEAWTMRTPWAPEVVYNEKEEKYYMFYNMISKLREEGELRKGGETKTSGTVLIATVEGDIHDIGKNLVVLMLKNYGYRVIDLGKDVTAEEIISVAKQENAKIIGLSALMTTTMMQMGRISASIRSQYCSSLAAGATNNRGMMDTRKEAASATFSSFSRPVDRASSKSSIP